MAMNDLMRARESEHARHHLATGHVGRFRAFFFCVELGNVGVKKEQKQEHGGRSGEERNS